MSDKGVIYAVTGEEYLSEVYKSVRSVKKSNSSMSITIFSDVFPKVIKNEYSDVDFIDITEGEFQKRPKVECLSKTPYNQTLYLDSDTYVQGDLNNIFDFLEGFDIVCKRAKQNYEWVHKSQKNKNFPADISNEEEFRKRLGLNTPHIMPDYNTGVIAYNMNDETGEFLNYWEKIYKEHVKIPEYHRDQPAFRKAVFNTDIKIGAALPPECNCRVKSLYESRGLIERIQWRPLIVHGGANNIKQSAKNINRRVEGRGYIVKPKTIFNELFERGWLFTKSMQYDGFKLTLQRSKEYIMRQFTTDNNGN